ncbi:vegetative cell wall protein gp1-like [Schistocerca americana]|uniref:vegetative cell wall protein gp1-like n=1 Tax=Schistocerca americana TaxID=7009 RepID=UPI001F4FEF0D|nr:vegetative cell wall protein gp1-like [Schistocerca americana]
MQVAGCECMTFSRMQAKTIRVFLDQQIMGQQRESRTSDGKRWRQRRNEDKPPGAPAEGQQPGSLSDTASGCISTSPVPNNSAPKSPVCGLERHLQVDFSLESPVALIVVGRCTIADADDSDDLVRGGFQPRLPTSLPPPGQQQQPSPLPRRQPVPLMPPAQLHPGAPHVVAPAPAVPLQSPPPSELIDVDSSAGPPSQAVAVQPVLQPLSLGTPKESDTAAPCPAPTQQPSTQRQETLPLFVGPDAPSRPVPEAAPVDTGNNDVFIATFICHVAE